MSSDIQWIDFPREGNGWSYKYARRQWDLVHREDLKYKYLNAFDNAMVELVSKHFNFQALPVEKLGRKMTTKCLLSAAAS